jgi:hypothetical protein
MIRAVILRQFLASLLCRFVVLILVTRFGVSHLFADPIPVKEKQGATFGFLVVKSAEDKVIAMADDINTVEGNRITSRTVFHFRDGSIDDEVSVFTQGSIFQLISDHHIQKGPSFPEPMDMSINVPSKTVSWREMKNDKDDLHSEHMDLPSDLANGMTSLIGENFPANAAELKVSYLAGTSKPRVLKLSIKPDGEETFQVAGVARHSKKYRIHIEIGGVAGLIAPLIGKQPSDIEMWVTTGNVATFLKMQGPLYNKGPIWTTELAAPTWPATRR